MPGRQYKQEPHLLDAGRLGWIEGLKLSGSANENEVVGYYFGGLPYALPPVGPFRFRQSRPLPECFRYGTKSNPGRYSGATALCPQPRDKTQSQWDEDCLQLNIHIPAGEPPQDGWPVFFFIHGGFLQWGSANEAPSSLIPLQHESAFKAIIVFPAYRLNAFGFLASRELLAEARQHGEPTGNQGFWDQRLALEWTAQNIALFGGNGGNITVGGYSAGSHSAFQQLAHELYFVPDSKAVIRRVIMWSNSPGVQPKALPEAQQQFDQLLAALDIPATLSTAAKLAQLRAAPAADIVRASSSIAVTEFRALSDDAFVASNAVARINAGDFARRMRARGVRLLNGECRDEHAVYQRWRPPTPNPTFAAVFRRLCADYPERAVRRLVAAACPPDGRSLPAAAGSGWLDAFGRLYADMQVHALERGFHAALARGGLVFGKDVLRYRFDWRAKCVDAVFPPDWGVTHATDMAIWFWGLDYGDGLTEEEKTRVLKPWNELFAAFVKGDEPEWPTRNVKEMLRLRSDGETDVWVDDRWEEGLRLWDAVNGTPGVLDWIKSKL